MRGDARGAASRAVERRELRVRGIPDWQRRQRVRRMLRSQSGRDGDTTYCEARATSGVTQPAARPTKAVD